MSRSTDQALHSLLPTHNGEFSAQLTNLASSLLAQSRHRASTLKAEEEIARPYACAHIACDRLKTSLNLPPIEARPPIPPRLYKRLYTHLNTILQPAPGRASSRNIERSSLSSPARSARSARSATTPRRGAAPKSATATPAKQTTPARATPRTATRIGTASHFPVWLRPTVRFVCDSLGHSRITPTVVAGLAAIYSEAVYEKKDKAPTRDAKKDDETKEDHIDWIKSHWTALAGSICYYCSASWRQKQTSGRGLGQSGIVAEIQESGYVADEKAILEAFRKARLEVQLPDESASGGSADWEAAGWRDLSRRDLRDALLVVSEANWLKSDWFRDIQHLKGRRGGEDIMSEDEHEDENDNDNDDDGAGSIPTQAWRADGMLQRRYDFLSETKLQAYETWKAGLLERMGEPMQVDATS